MSTPADARLRRLVQAEVDRLALDDVEPAAWWEWRRRWWRDGVLDARSVTRERLIEALAAKGANR